LVEIEAKRREAEERAQAARAAWLDKKAAQQRKEARAAKARAAMEVAATGAATNATGPRKSGRDAATLPSGPPAAAGAADTSQQKPRGFSTSEGTEGAAATDSTSAAPASTPPSLDGQEASKRRVQTWARQRRRGLRQQERDAEVRRQRMSEFAELWKAHKGQQRPTQPHSSSAAERSSSRTEQLAPSPNSSSASSAESPGNHLAREVAKQQTASEAITRQQLELRRDIEQEKLQLARLRAARRAAETASSLAAASREHRDTVAARRERGKEFAEKERTRRAKIHRSSVRARAIEKMERRRRSRSSERSRRAITASTVGAAKPHSSLRASALDAARLRATADYPASATDSGTAYEASSASSDGSWGESDSYRGSDDDGGGDGNDDDDDDDDSVTSSTEDVLEVTSDVGESCPAEFAPLPVELAASSAYFTASVDHSSFLPAQPRVPTGPHFQMTPAPAADAQHGPLETMKATQPVDTDVPPRGQEKSYAQHLSALTVRVWAASKLQRVYRKHLFLRVEKARQAIRSYNKRNSPLDMLSHVHPPYLTDVGIGTTTDHAVNDVTTSTSAVAVTSAVVDPVLPAEVPAKNSSGSLNSATQASRSATQIETPQTIDESPFGYADFDGVAYDDGLQFGNIAAALFGQTPVPTGWPASVPQKRDEHPGSPESSANIYQPAFDTVQSSHLPNPATAVALDDLKAQLGAISVDAWTRQLRQYAEAQSSSADDTGPLRQDGTLSNGNTSGTAGDLERSAVTGSIDVEDGVEDEIDPDFERVDALIAAGRSIPVEEAVKEFRCSPGVLAERLSTAVEYLGMVEESHAQVAALQHAQSLGAMKQETLVLARSLKLQHARAAEQNRTLQEVEERSRQELDEAQKSCQQLKAQCERLEHQQEADALRASKASSESLPSAQAAINQDEAVLQNSILEKEAAAERQEQRAREQARDAQFERQQKLFLETYSATMAQNVDRQETNEQRWLDLLERQRSDMQRFVESTLANTMSLVKERAVGSSDRPHPGRRLRHDDHAEATNRLSASESQAYTDSFVEESLNQSLAGHTLEPEPEPELAIPVGTGAQSEIEDDVEIRDDVGVTDVSEDRIEIEDGGAIEIIDEDGIEIEDGLAESFSMDAVAVDASVSFAADSEIADDIEIVESTHSSHAIVDEVSIDGVVRDASVEDDYGSDSFVATEPSKNSVQSKDEIDESFGDSVASAIQADGDSDSLLREDLELAQKLHQQKEEEIILQNQMLDNRWKAALQRAKAEMTQLRRQESEAEAGRGGRV
jgi:hypothetical protein